MTDRQVHGQGLLTGVGDIVHMDKSGSVYVPAHDQVGTVWNLLDDAAAKANSYTYDAFGEGRSASETVSNLFRFQTKPLDAETDQYCFVARQYDQSTGRFLQRDPVVFWNTMSRYGFPSQNPITNVDIWGLWASDIHFYMTFYIAYECNLGGYYGRGAEAKSVAWSDLYVGISEETLLAGQPIGWARKYHFLGDRRKRKVFPGGPGTGGPIVRYLPVPVAGGERARRLIDKAVQTGNIFAFGAALHTYQDTWAHEGLTPPAHAELGHAPDIPYDNFKDYMDMARATYKAMDRFSRRRGLGGCEADWEDLVETLSRTALKAGDASEECRRIWWHDMVEKKTGLPLPFKKERGGYWTKQFNKNLIDPDTVGWHLR